MLSVHHRPLAVSRSCKMRARVKPCVPRKIGQFTAIRCLNQGKDNEEDEKKKAKESEDQKPLKRFLRLFQHPWAGHIMRIVVNIVGILILQEIWPYQGKSLQALQAADTSHTAAIVAPSPSPAASKKASEDDKTTPSPPSASIAYGQVPYSQFLHHVRRNEVMAVVTDTDSTTIAFATTPLPNPSDPSLPSASRRHVTLRPATCQVPWADLEANGVSFSSTEKGGWMQDAAYWVCVFVVIVFVLNRAGRFKISDVLKGVGKKHDKGGKGEIVTFKDVAGVDEAKEELREIVEFLKSPSQFTKLGARPPSGVLLVGPPGTGKTMLAKAVAGEASVPFFSISGSEFVEMFVGMGASRVREIFAKARKDAPSILFIDEIDAVGKSRSDSRRSFGGNDEREQTLNQLLTELDGFDSSISSTDKEGKERTSKAVIVIAATNRADVLDPALLRPGRFDRRVPVERPDRQGRKEILSVHISNKGLPLSPDFDADAVAAATTGLSGADLANIVNEAAWLAGRAGMATVGQEQFDAALLRSVAGIEKKRSILRGEEKSVVARHESGHAIVATAIHKLLPQFTCPVEKLSIVPRSGGALGFTYIPPKTEDRALIFLTEIRANLVVLMGGRAAEMLLHESVSSGAVDDIRRATDLAQRTVCEYGLSSAVGPLNVPSMLVGGGASSMEDMRTAAMYGQANQPAAGLARSVEDEVRGLVNGALSTAVSILSSNRSVLLSLSSALEAQEKLGGSDLQTWLDPEVLTTPSDLKAFVFGQ